jgi:hypothetical protein
LKTWFKKFFKSKTSGSTGVIMTFGLMALLTSFFYMTGDLIGVRKSYSMREWRLRVAREAAVSAYTLMEAALRRRQWEPPPDKDCLKSLLFDLSGKSPDGADYKVTGIYDPPVQMIILDASATYMGVTQTFRRTIKTLDASDFLVFSKSSGYTEFSKHYGLKDTSGVIAKDRRVYFEGPVGIRGSHFGGTSPQSWTGPTSVTLPSQLVTLFQSERMQFLGGLSSPDVGGWALPSDPSFATLRAMLTPWTARRVQMPMGANVFHKDYAFAMDLKRRVRLNVDGNITQNEIQSFIYPHSLTTGSGTLPIDGASAPDTGTYINNMQKWREWAYTAPMGQSANFDYTCFSTSSKNCTNSKHFPKGFEQWVKDADLVGVLQTAESEKVSLPAISWDNFEALEEDAKACGLVIDTPPAGYTDCDLSETNTFLNYVNSGTDPCGTIPTLDLETLSGKFANFSMGAYSNSANTGRFLRRVVYSKVKLQLDQKNSQGIMMDVPNDGSRQNLPVWIISEDKFILKPYQDNEDFDAWKAKLTANHYLRKQTYFNQDAAGLYPGIKMALISPEALQIVSPFHVPLNFDDVKAAYPRVAGKINTKVLPEIDYLRQENDYFKFGVRDVNIGNVVLVSNSQQVSKASGIALRGVWGGTSSIYSPSGMLMRACLFDPPGDADALAAQFYPLDPNCPPSKCPASGPSADPLCKWPDGADMCDGIRYWKTQLAQADIQTDAPFIQYYTDWLTVPNHVNNAGSLLPPTAPVMSRFYRNPGTGPVFPWWLAAAILDYQAGGLDNSPANIIFTGVRLLVDFDKTVISGKRDLSKQNYTYTDYHYDKARFMDGRKVRWNSKFYYTSTGPNYDKSNGRSCENGIGTVAWNPHHYFAWMNQDNQNFNQLSPPDEYRNVGNLFGVEMPVIELGEK